MTSVRISRLAEADLDEIWTYLSTVSTEAADELILRIYQQARLIATQPRMGREKFDLYPELRSFPVAPYMLFYRPRDGGGIEVVRIIHGRRDITPALF
jgi:toxin ParE1/3/4